MGRSLKPAILCSVVSWQPLAQGIDRSGSWSHRRRPSGCRAQILFSRRCDSRDLLQVHHYLTRRNHILCRNGEVISNRLCGKNAVGDPGCVTDRPCLAIGAPGDTWACSVLIAADSVLLYADDLQLSQHRVPAPFVTAADALFDHRRVG